MSKGYESLKEVAQKTLQRSKAGFMAIARVNGTTASSLNEEIERLEKSVVDGLGRLKTAINDGEAEVVDEAQQAEQLIESLKANIATLEGKVKEVEETVLRKDSASQSMEKNLTAKIALLESQLRETEKIVFEKESTLKTLDQNLNGKIKELEGQLRANEKILAGRHAQIKDLQAQLQSLTHGIKEMSSFFRKAEALAVVEAPVSGAVPSGERQNDKAATARLAALAAASDAIDPAREIVSPAFFADLIQELTEAIGPLAAMVVRDHVAAFGESMEKFPKARVPELLQTISQEILDENRKVTFRERLTVTL